MLRVAVVEDDRECCGEICGMVEKYAYEHGMEIAVTPFADGGEIADRDTSAYDIIFLDIDMPGLDGMQTAERIRERDGEVILVFITNLAQYAIKGYEVDALDFILKPVNYYAFSMRFTRVIGRVKEREGKKICLSLPGGVVNLDSRDIYFIETKNRMLNYCTRQGEYAVYGTLKQVLEELSPFHFMKCNHWYVVNLRYVSEIRDNIVVVAGHELEISRRSRTAFLEAVTGYMSENI